MKMRALSAGIGLVLLVALGAIRTNGQIPKQDLKVKVKIPPHISSVAQDFPPGAINLLIYGTNFGAKESDDHKTFRKARLAPVAGGEATYAGGNRTWTSNRIEDYLGFSTIAGRRFRIGIVTYSSDNIEAKTLISNEVEHLLLMNLDHTTPSHVSPGTQEIQISTANRLGDRGSKIVKFGGITAEVTMWGGPDPNGGNFKIRVPSVKPGLHDVWVEDGGVVVSDRLGVQIQETTKK